MSNPLAAMFNGISAVATHWQTLFGIILVLAASQFLLYLLLKRIFGNAFTGEEYFSLGLAGWILPASLISLFWYALGLILSPQVSLLISIVFVLVSGLVLFVQTHRVLISSSSQLVFSLLLLAVLFGILRLAFIARAVFPMYFDSAQHYQLTKGILATLDPAYGNIWTLTSYYHLGFHFLAAFLTFITHAQINDVMLLIGQVILALMPFSMFFIVRQWTRSSNAAMFALLLAALGWYMPAHAVDWGKYPALTGIALTPFVLSLAYLSIQNRRILSTGKFLSLNAILLVSAIVSVLLHSRVIIVLIIVALTGAMAFVWQKLSEILRLLILALVTIALITGIILIQTKGILGPLFDPYGIKAIVVTCAVLFLSFFAYRSYPALVFSCIISSLLLLVCLFIPLRNLFLGLANITLLDRPFVEMIFYLPLTLLGGFGLAGLEGFVEARKNLRNIFFTLSRTISYTFIAIVVVNAFFKVDLYPADCCDIVSYDDLEAIGWMDNNLPRDARILTSSTELNVLPTDVFQGNAGGDAGTWIPALINRATVLMPFNTDFSQPQTLDTICQNQVNYIYVGKTGWSFDDSKMTLQPEVYKLLFSIPNAKIYQVTGCK